MKTSDGIQIFGFHFFSNLFNKKFNTLTTKMMMPMIIITVAPGRNKKTILPPRKESFFKI